MTSKALTKFVFSNIYNLRFNLDVAHTRLLKAWRENFAREKNAAFDANAVKTIALFFVGRIGDAIIVLPAVQSLRRAFPNARIHAFVNQNVKTIWEMGDCVDEFFVYNLSLYVLKPDSFKKLRELKLELRRVKPDLAINMWEHEWGSLLFKEKIRWRVGPQEFKNAFQYTHVYSVPGWSATPQNGFTAARWFRILEILGVKNGTLDAPKLNVSSAARESASQFLRANNIESNRRIFVLHPFGSVEKRWWDMREAAELIEILGAYDESAAIIIIGGKDQQSAAKEFLQTKRALNAVGELPLETTIGLIERANLVVTADSGPLHLAGALKTPTIAILRALRTDHRATYDHSFYRAVWNDDTPACFRECDWENCAQIPCRQMSAVAAQTVFNKAVELLNEIESKNIRAETVGSNLSK